MFIHDCTTVNCWESQSEWELPKSGEIGIVKDKSKGKVLEVGKKNPFVPLAVKLYSPYLKSLGFIFIPISTEKLILNFSRGFECVVDTIYYYWIDLIENFLLLKVPIPDSTALVT